MRGHWIAMFVMGSLLTGCASSERQARYDAAMRSTVSELRIGNLQAARTSVEVARENACKDCEEDKARDLELLIAGAEAYSNGDRTTAGEVWSETESVVLRDSLARHESALGVQVDEINQEGADW
jgi:hypothetical protein